MRFLIVMMVLIGWSLSAWAICPHKQASPSKQEAAASLKKQAHAKYGVSIWDGCVGNRLSFTQYKTFLEGFIASAEKQKLQKLYIPDPVSVIPVSNLNLEELFTQGNFVQVHYDKADQSVIWLQNQFPKAGTNEARSLQEKHRVTRDLIMQLVDRIHTEILTSSETSYVGADGDLVIPRNGGAITRKSIAYFHQDELLRGLYGFYQEKKGDADYRYSHVTIVRTGRDSLLPELLQGYNLEDYEYSVSEAPPASQVRRQMLAE